MKNEKEILEMYVGRRYPNPIKQREYVFATDGNILIKINESDIEGEYVSSDKPNAESVLIETRNSKTLSIGFIDKLLSDVEKVEEVKYIGEDVECKECNGEGTVLWEYMSYTKEFDCPVCNGTGYESYKKEVPTGRMIPDPWEALPIFGKIFRVKYLSVLKRTMEIMNLSEIEMRYNDISLEASIFCFGENTEVLLMPCRNE